MAVAMVWKMELREKNSSDSGAGSRGAGVSGALLLAEWSCCVCFQRWRCCY
jgi:hypothetical protein